MAFNKDSFIITVPGAPVPWARPSPRNRGMYDTQKHLKLITKSHILQQLPDDFVFYHGPLELSVIFYLQQPTSKRGAMYATYAPHYFKPDLSNLVKHIEDCCSGVLFDDDACIAITHSYKVYGLPRTEFMLKELKHA